VSRLQRTWHRLPRPARQALAAVVGGTLVAAGAVMLIVPGPGLLSLALGMAVLATEFAWPRRLLRRLVTRLPARGGGAGPGPTGPPPARTW
jgi:UPF0716 family protein affecting phage T7 exclusion